MISKTFHRLFPIYLSCVFVLKQQNNHGISIGIEIHYNTQQRTFYHSYREYDYRRSITCAIHKIAICQKDNLKI